jgi:Zn-dependent protease
VSETIATATAAPRCTSCGTELAPDALACPRCKTLVYSNRLKEFASLAQQHESAGETESAINHWNSALLLLPAESTQHQTIRQRITDLVAARAAMTDSASAKPVKKEGPAWRRGLAGVGAVLLLTLGKLKFLLLGLTKLSTFVSMFAFFGVYWNLYGWPLAAGLVISIYIHEMGHVMEIRRLGISASAPLFVPGLGALVMLKQHVDDPVVDARIGLGGPIWGALAALAAFAVYLATKSDVWAAIAQLGAYINLFNLLPVWSLDGSRAFHALARNGRLIVAATCVALVLVTGQKMLLLIAAVAAYRAFKPMVATSDRRTLATFAVLLATLAGLAAVKPGL